MSINLEFLEILAKIFCGDKEELFLYNSGPQLVLFFIIISITKMNTVKVSIFDGDMFVIN